MCEIKIYTEKSEVIRINGKEVTRDEILNRRIHPLDRNTCLERIDRILTKEITTEKGISKRYLQRSKEKSSGNPRGCNGGGNRFQ